MAAVEEPDFGCFTVIVANLAKEELCIWVKGFDPVGVIATGAALIAVGINYIELCFIPRDLALKVFRIFETVSRDFDFLSMFQ